jgi:hypothetical protein
MMTTRSGGKDDVGWRDEVSRCGGYDGVVRVT